MKKASIKLAIAAAILAGSGAANAALLDGSALSITQGTTGGTTKPVAGTGSWFSMLALDTDFDGIPDTTLYTPIGGNDGLIVGSLQAATGSHAGPPGCSAVADPLTCDNPVPNAENPGIDNPWSFFGNTGMHATTSAATLLTASGNNATLDFSGWSVTWNGIADIPMGSNTWGGGIEGTATITCSGGSGNCSEGSDYTLDYMGTVPLGDPSNFGGVRYAVHMEGVVGAVVPVPAAVWLFGSGLLGLVGIARRRHVA